MRHGDYGCGWKRFSGFREKHGTRHGKQPRRERWGAVAGAFSRDSPVQCRDVGGGDPKAPVGDGAVAAGTRDTRLIHGYCFSFSFHFICDTERRGLGTPVALNT